MPVSHSHQFLCVSLRPFSTVVSSDRAFRRRDVPDLLPRGAERAQQVGLATVAFRQILSVAGAHHLRASGFAFALLSRDVGEIFRVSRIGHVEDRCAIRLDHAGQGVQVLAAMVADVRNPAALLLVDHRMVAAARLQIVVAQQAHVPALRLPAFLGQCRRRTGREPRNSTHRGRQPRATKLQLIPR